MKVIKKTKNVENDIKNALIEANIYDLIEKG